MLVASGRGCGIPRESAGGLYHRVIDSGRGWQYPLDLMNQGVELTGYEHMAHDKLIEESTSISARLMAAYAGRRAQRVAPRAAGGAANIGM